MKMNQKKYHSITWAAVLAASTLASCAGADETTDESTPGDGGEPVIAEISQALSVLEAPICEQRLATSMSGGGTYSQHPGGTMRLETPGSHLSFWPNPPMGAGQWEFRISARAHGNGNGYPTLRFWANNQLIGQKQMTSSTSLRTYTFYYQYPATGSSIPFTIEYAGSQSSRDLIVEGVDIVCPGISCGDNVCTGDNICCVGSELDEPVCTTNSCYSGGIYGFTSPRHCDRHDECDSGELCGFALQGNAGGGYMCIPQQNFSNPSAPPYELCASPGWSDPCGSGQTCGAADDLGYRICGVQ